MHSPPDRITLQRINRDKINYVIYWVVICLGDRVVRPLNNWTGGA